MVKPSAIGSRLIGLARPRASRPPDAAFLWYEPPFDPADADEAGEPAGPADGDASRRQPVQRLAGKSQREV